MAAGAGAGAGGMKFVKDAAVQEFAQPVAAVHKASLAALKKLSLAVKEEKLDAFSSRISGSFADDKTLSLSADKVTDASTRLTVRVGPFGDRERAKSVLDAVAGELK